MKGSKSLRMIAAAGIAALTAGVAASAQSVQELADRWTSAYNSHDEAALGALYTDSAQVYVHGQPSYVGRESIQAFWAGDMQVDNPLTVLTVTHAVDGVDMKLVHGDYQVIGRDTGVPLGGGRFAHIWLLGPDGEWYLDRDLWNQPYTAVTGG